MSSGKKKRDPFLEKVSGVTVGMGFGVAMGGLLSAWATVVRILAGPSAFADLNTSYLLVVATYLGTGLVAGALVGVLGRYVQGRISAALLGFVVAVPCGLAFATAMGNTPPWSAEDLVVTLIFAATLGAGVGYQYWRIFSGDV